MNTSPMKPTETTAPQATAETAVNAAPHAAAAPSDKGAPVAAGTSGLHDLAPEMRKQWTKFSDADLAGVKGQDDLTSKVEKIYAIPHADAKKQVQSWAQGRQF